MKEAQPWRTASTAAILTTLLTVVTAVVAIGTPPLSGPLCQAGCFQYPYLDVASRFPRDYYWMYPAMLQAAAFLFLMASIHAVTPPDWKAFSLTAVSFGVIGAGTLLVTYFTQLAVIQPSLVRGEADGIPLLSQFNPHGLFIALEEIGYLTMAAALGCAGFTFRGVSAAERALRWILPGGLCLGLAAFAFFQVKYGLEREYLFEIAIISISWLTLLAAGPLLVRVFRRRSAALR